MFITVEKDVNNLFYPPLRTGLGFHIFVVGILSQPQGMFGTLLRKKVSEEKLANVFINGLFSTIDNSFPIIADFINEDPAFVISPEISPKASYEFSIIVIVGNMSFLESAFDAEQADNIERLTYDKLAKVYGMSVEEFVKMANDYKRFMNRLNHPSKNMVYAMSKSIFDKYKLYNFQDEYFKRMQAPNPLFIKRLDEIVENFVWDWDAFFKRYKLD